MSHPALVRAVRQFENASPDVRRHVKIRNALSRLEAVEEHVAKSGDVLEIGCGHGLFSYFLAFASPDRRVLGVDIDPRKIEAAKAVVDGVPNVRFEMGDALKPPAGPFDGAVVVDVLYLLDEAGQAAAVAATRKVMKPGAWFVWKSQENKPAWKYALTKGQEWLATRLGLTAGSSLTFLSRERATDIMKAAGFQEIRAIPMTGRLYTDVTYLARA